MSIYTVEWGHYENDGGTKVQDGDEEVFAENENDAIEQVKTRHFGYVWIHGYLGTSKWG